MALSSEELYTGAIKPIDFFLTLLVNFLFIFIIWTAIKYLRLNKKWSFQKTLLIVFSLSILPDVSTVFLAAGSTESLLELGTSSIPSALTIIGAINLYYQYLLSLKKNGAIPKLSQLSDVTPTLQIPLSTTRGKTQIAIDQLAFIQYRDKKTYVYLVDESCIICFDSLNTLAQRLPDKEYFFQLNRNVLSHRSAIQKFQTQSDSRIKVWIHGQEFMVSKNKALKFKRWFEILA